MENIFFKTYIFTENIQSAFKQKLPLVFTTLYLDWIHLDQDKHIENILVKRRKRLFFWHYFIIVKNYDLENNPRKIVNEINLAQYTSYKENSLTHVIKKRKKFSVYKKGKKYSIVYDKYCGPLEKYSVITVKAKSENDIKSFMITDLVKIKGEECILHGINLVYYLQQKQSS